MDRWLYLLIDLGAISIPFLAGFDRRLRFDKQWRYFFPAALLTMLVFIPWDMAKTSLNVWGFNSKYISGIVLGNLPLEEWLFFIAIPYACLFTYHALNQMIERGISNKFAGRFSVVLSIVLILIGMANYSKLYTGVTFISTGLFLLFHHYFLRPEYMGKFLRMYLLTLIPFFIVNGLLTGSWIPEEVVCYDNNENLGIRLGTIPLEDMVYGFLLLLMNVSWYEYLKSRDLQA